MEHLIGQVMLVKINGQPVVISEIHDNIAMVTISRPITINKKVWGTHRSMYLLGQLTTNPALVVQSVGGN